MPRRLNDRQPWTEEDDRFLLAYGWCVGIAFITDHDLDRSAKYGYARALELAKTRPDLVDELWQGEETVEEAVREQISTHRHDMAEARKSRAAYAAKAAQKAAKEARKAAKAVTPSPLPAP